MAGFHNNAGEAGRELTNMEIGFIGVGAMGAGMVPNLLKAGHAVTVWNRTRAPLAALLALGASEAVRLADAAAHPIVISMLADDAAMEQVLSDGEVLRALPEGGVHIAMATISVALAERFAAAHAAAGRHYVSAPVFGRPPAAAAAQLFIVAAGAPAVLAHCAPVFAALGQRVFTVGENPALANVVKISGNFMLASMIESLGEAFALVRKYGIDPQAFLEVITGTVFPAPVYRNYGGMIANDVYQPAGFTLRLGLKDVRLAQAAADRAMVPMPVAGVLHDQYMTAIARGYGEFDWAGLGRLCAEDAGLPPRA
jgi:3-hydroxyisobutyrate dehydrogenase-like beta-hydroxyacid dehydrogenase